MAVNRDATKVVIGNVTRVTYFMTFSQSMFAPRTLRKPYVNLTQSMFAPRTLRKPYVEYVCPKDLT